MGAKQSLTRKDALEKAEKAIKAAQDSSLENTQMWLDVADRWMHLASMIPVWSNQAYSVV